MTRREKNPENRRDSAETLPDPPERDELLSLLGEKAREGNVQAIKTLLEEHRRDDDSPNRHGFEALDGENELQARRKQRNTA